MENINVSIRIKICAAHGSTLGTASKICRLHPQFPIAQGNTIKIGKILEEDVELLILKASGELPQTLEEATIITVHTSTIMPDRLSYSHFRVALSDLGWGL